jgi:hypothetical protein
MKIDLNKKRVIPEVTYSVVENLGWDARDKKQRTVGTITQLQFIDLQEMLSKETNEKENHEEKNRNKKTN